MMPDQESARAACEAGYITVREYLDMMAENGWPAAPANVWIGEAGEGDSYSALDTRAAR